MKILLVPNYYKEAAIESARSIEDCFGGQGAEVIWAADQRSPIQSEPDVLGCDLVVSLGGDGTLLRAVHLVENLDVPVLGISYGHLGFLTAASPEERNVLSVVSDALAGDMHVSRRAMLTACVRSFDDTGLEHLTCASGLNDMALTRGPLSEMIEFDMTVSGHHIDRLRGDGVVISTATGSTGYALSAGGPIVNPEFSGLVCVPIAAHTIQARAFLTSPSDVVGIAISHDRPSVPAVAIDGQFLDVPGAIDSVTVSRSMHDALLLDYGPESFYSSVSRVFYGERGHD
ncbi:MAG: NAD(+)/NADH kinase [Coriobacteriaceae bacterium]|nr:NAD(+)/NADH kinase [Coriobacteriaceae bacterium]